MGQRSARKTRLLAQWVSGDWKVDHRSDVLRNGRTGWDPWRKFLLFSRLPQQKGDKKHLPHTRIPTRMPVPLISRSDRSGYKAGPIGSSAELARISTQGPDRRPPPIDRYFVRYRNRRPGR